METDCIDLTEIVMRDQDIEFESKLIKLIKDQKCLYVKDHIWYENKQQKDFAWLNISKTLGKSTTECINKWYNLVQTFLYLHSLESKGYRRMAVVKWPHYEALKELNSQMVEKYMDLVLSFQIDSRANASLSKTQKEALLTEMESKSEELMSVNISNALRQEIWANIANKLNAMTSGTPLPTIQWQKIWWDIKRMIAFRKKLELKDINVRRVGSVANEDSRVLKICGLTTTNLNKSIAGLESFIEFDVNTDQEICKNCGDLKTGSRLCVNCSPLEALLCDVCVSHTSSKKCDITCWSSVAKCMIPIERRYNRIIAICEACHTNLKRKAALLWKTCRFCAQGKPNLKNFLSPSLQLVREAFCSATNITICMSDGLPCFVCTDCLNQLHHFQQFYMEFCNAQIILQKIHETRFIANDLMKDLHKSSDSKMSVKGFKSCQDAPISAAENFKDRTSKQVLLSKSEVSNMCSRGNGGQKESNPATIKYKALDSQEKLIQNIKSIQERIAESMRNPTSVPVIQSVLKAKFSTYRESSNHPLKSSCSNTIALHKDKDDIYVKSADEVVLQSESSNADPIPRVFDEVANSRLPKKAAVAASIELAPNPLEISKLVDRTPVAKSRPSSSSQLLISNVFSLNQSNSQPKELQITSRESYTKTHGCKNLFSDDASRAFIPQVKRTISKPLNSSNKPPPAAESQVQIARPAIPNVMQRVCEPDNVSPLKKSTLNPLLQSLLDKPALDPSSSYNPIRIQNCIPPPEKQVLSSVAKQIEVKKSSKLVPCKGVLNSSIPVTSNSPNEDSTINTAPKKSLERRKTMYELALPKRSNSVRKTSLKEEVIVVRDDTPPKDVELASAHNSPNLYKLCPEPNDEFTPLEGVIVNVEEEEDLNVSSSTLIDYAIDKAYSKHSSTLPQRRNEAALTHFQLKKIKNSPNKTDEMSPLENSQEKEVERKRASRKRPKQNDEEWPKPVTSKRMSLRSNKSKSKDVVIK